jgi:hypothetical protein
MQDPHTEWTEARGPVTLVFKGLLQIAKKWPVELEILRTGHTTYDGPHGHNGGWAVDLHNYISVDYTQTTKIMKWLNVHKVQLQLWQLIGANANLVIPSIPGYYDQKTLDAHKTHLHLGFGPYRNGVPIWGY